MPVEVLAGGRQCVIGEEQALKHRRPSVILPGQGVFADGFGQGSGNVDLQHWADGQQALLAPNAEGFSPQKTHRSPQLLSTFRANTFCPTQAAARITCSVCFSDQTPSLARWTIYGLLDALCS